MTLKLVLEGATEPLVDLYEGFKTHAGLPSGEPLHPDVVNGIQFVYRFACEAALDEMSRQMRKGIKEPISNIMLAAELELQKLIDVDSAAQHESTT